MCDLIALAAGFISGIFLYYAPSDPVRLFIVFMTAVLSYFLYREKRRYAVFMTAGTIISMMSCLYHDFQPLNTVTLNGRTYIRCEYQRRRGDKDLFVSGTGKISLKAGYTDEFLKGKTYLMELKGENKSRELSGIVFAAADDAGILKTGFISLKDRSERIREEIATQNIGSFGDETGHVINSLVLGIRDRDNMEKEGILRSLGIIHILSISGFHINLLESFLDRMKLRKAALPILAVYSYLIGSVPCTRALLMKSCSSLATILKRDSDRKCDLFISAMIQLAVSPYLIADMSFLLTYSATLGMILFARKFQILISRLPLTGMILTQGIGSSLSALTLSAPFLNLMGNNIPLSLIPANIVIVPAYSAFCTLSFIAVPLRNTYLAELLSPVLRLILSLTSFLEGVLIYGPYHAVNACYISVIIWCIFTVILNRAFSESNYLHYPRYSLKFLIISMTAVHLISMKPFITNVRFEQDMGISYVRVEHHFEKKTFVNVKIYRPGKREGLIPVTWEKEYQGIRISPSEGDFPNVSYRGYAITLKEHEAKSDIIKSEYFLLFGRMIRTR